MSRTTQILIILIVLLSVSAVISVLFITTNPKDSVPDLRKPTTQPSNQNTINKILNLLKSKKDQKCTITADIKNIPVTGNIFVSNGFMKGEFKPEYFPTDIRGNFIISGNTIYIWTNIEKDGYKRQVASNQDSMNNNGIITDLAESMKLSCASWRSDPQVFDIPKNINFRDENALSSPSAITPTKQ